MTCNSFQFPSRLSSDRLPFVLLRCLQELPRYYIIWIQEVEGRPVNPNRDLDVSNGDTVDVLLLEIPPLESETWFSSMLLL